MTAFKDFLKIRYRLGKIADGDLSNVVYPKGIKNNKKLSADEITDIKDKKPKKGKK